MVENRKLFFAISFMLLTCCQMITMLPHHMASSESNSTTAATFTIVSSRGGGNNSENKNAKRLQETKGNESQNNNDSDFLIIAVQRKQQAEQLQQQRQTIVSSERVGEEQELDSRPADNIDDLIFLDKRPINQHHQQHDRHNPSSDRQQHQREPLQNEQTHFEFRHITMDGGGSSNSNSNSNSNEDDTDSLTDTTYSSMIVVDDEDEDEDVDGDVDEDEDEHVAEDGVPHEIELQPDINEEVTPLSVTPLDLSDFLSLIPATKVKTIVNHYYHNDPEVQRAHAFMSSGDFLMLKQHIIAVPEMSAFLHYLNNSGLDLVKFVTALTNLTSYENANSNANANGDANANTATTTSATTETSDIASTFAAAVGMENSINNTATANVTRPAGKQSDETTPTIADIEIQIATNQPHTTQQPATALDDAETTTAKEQLNGLHGLVDSVLDVLPQDQILATFFDKLEANEQFSKLVDSIGSPEFAKILNNMQNSMPLKNLIFTLHNNGIYVVRIVDSLKSYFFLGGF